MIRAPKAGAVIPLVVAVAAAALFGLYLPGKEDNKERDACPHEARYYTGIGITHFQVEETPIEISEERTFPFGVVVHGVFKNSPAARADIARGDIIVMVNNNTPTIGHYGSENFKKTIQSERGATIRLVVLSRTTSGEYKEKDVVVTTEKIDTALYENSEIEFDAWYPIEMRATNLQKPLENKALEDFLISVRAMTRVEDLGSDGFRYEISFFNLAKSALNMNGVMPLLKNEFEVTKLPPDLYTPGHSFVASRVSCAVPRRMPYKISNGLNTSGFIGLIGPSHWIWNPELNH